jgi:transcriptional regulator with XRE-family HTH domain
MLVHKVRPETEHMIQILKTAMRVLGFTNREIEQKLGVSGGYLTRLFNGTMELRFEHVVDIARAIGLEPEEVFHLAYPQPRNPPTDSAQRLREMFPASAAAPPPVEVRPEPAVTDASALSTALEQDMERLMAKMFRKFFAEMMVKGAGE